MFRPENPPAWTGALTSHRPGWCPLRDEIWYWNSMFVRLSATFLALCALSLAIDDARAETGVAAYYRGGRTASGEVSGPNGFTAAHRTLPFGTVVRVTNIRNGRSVTVRINDRGPYGRGRVIDVSHAAARQLGMISSGTARVRVERQ
jgi:rare lipoprotein A